MVQVMACRLFGAKPLPQQMLNYYQLDHKEHTSVKFESEYRIFCTKKCIWKCRLRNVGYFVKGEDELRNASKNLSWIKHEH